MGWLLDSFPDLNEHNHTTEFPISPKLTICHGSMSDHANLAGFSFSKTESTPLSP